MKASVALRQRASAWQNGAGKSISANLRESLYGTSRGNAASPAHFARLSDVDFYPPHQWLSGAGLKSTWLLRDGGLSLAEDARACGFAIQSHFTRAYTRLVHQPRRCGDPGDSFEVITATGLPPSAASVVSIEQQRCFLFARACKPSLAYATFWVSPSEAAAAPILRGNKAAQAKEGFADLSVANASGTASDPAWPCPTQKKKNHEKRSTFRACTVSKGKLG